MPVMRACLSQGCPELVPLGESHCDRHRKAKEQARDTRTERGYDNRWLRYSKRYLALHPICVECHKAGKFVRSQCVDHIEPHKGNERLFWDADNHQALCNSCHSRKTVMEDGGFGR